jgi:hypothetical protein
MLAGMSNMLSSIVISMLADEPDIVIAGHVSQGHDMATELHRTNSDALIVQTARPDAVEPLAPLFSAFPNLKIVSIDHSCSTGFLHCLRPRSVPLPEISAAMLRTVLRAQQDPAGQSPL